MTASANYLLGTNFPPSWSIPAMALRYDISLGKMLDERRNTNKYPMPYLRNVDVQWDKISTADLPMMDIAPREAHRYVLHPGDLLVCEGGEPGRCAIWNGEIEPCAYQKALHRLRPLSSDESPRYMYYLLAAVVQTGFIGASQGKSTISHLPAEDLRRLRLPRPPYEEQILISSFLDAEITKADALLSQYERLIDLLEEKRISLITHIVTKGIDPAVPMKDSGIDWIGDIPAHWSIHRLKFHASKIGSGITPRGGAEVYTDSGIALLRSQNVRDEGLSLEDVKFISPEIDEKMSGTRVLEYDVLLNITGASIGRSCMVEEAALPANVNQHVCIVRPKSIDPAFLATVLKSQATKAQIHATENGSSREGLNFRQVGNLLLPVPPTISEQSDIVAKVKSVTLSLNRVSDKVQQAIMLGREHRSALITAAVTGQIYVRTYPSERRHPVGIPV